jgi:hypothetical protein
MIQLKTSIAGLQLLKLEATFRFVVLLTFHLLFSKEKNQLATCSFQKLGVPIEINGDESKQSYNAWACIWYI